MTNTVVILSEDNDKKKEKKDYFLFLITVLPTYQSIQKVMKEPKLR